MTKLNKIYVKLRILENVVRDTQSNCRPTEEQWISLTFEEIYTIINELEEENKLPIPTTKLEEIQQDVFVKLTEDVEGKLELIDAGKRTGFMCITVDGNVDQFLTDLFHKAYAQKLETLVKE
jgi:hypothetical protein